MNNEIKEILDRLDYNEWEVALYKVPITWCELYDIRDYITNLQQENERLKQNINKVINDINRYLDSRKIINDNTKYYYTNEFYKRPIKSNIAYIFNDYLEYLSSILQNGSDSQ